MADGTVGCYLYRWCKSDGERSVMTWPWATWPCLDTTYSRQFPVNYVLSEECFPPSAFTMIDGLFVPWNTIIPERTLETVIRCNNQQDKNSTCIWSQRQSSLLLKEGYIGQTKGTTLSNPVAVITYFANLTITRLFSKLLAFQYIWPKWHTMNHIYSVS